MKGKIKSSKGFFDIDVPFNENSNKDEEHYIICPICTPTRKQEHKNERKLAINEKTLKWRCNHCQEGGILINSDYLEKRGIKTIEYKKSSFLKLPDEIIKYFNSRSISEDTLNKLKIHSSWQKIRQIRHPDDNMKGKFLNTLCISFPFYQYGSLINIKYRDKRKNFKLEFKASKIFFNIDSVVNQDYAIITEGEIDTASFIETGYDSCISVPNGSSLTEREKKEFEKSGKIEETLSNINLEYLDKNIQDLSHIETFYLATDNDAAGFKLREELARRLGKGKCRKLDFSFFKDEDQNECNDPNQILQIHGKQGLIDLIEKHSIPYPVDGVSTAKDHKESLIHEYKFGKQKGLSTGYKTLDPYFNWMRGYTIAFNGFPSEGKTTFALNLAAISSVLYEFKWGIYSPENYPVKNIIDTLSEILINNTTDMEYKDRMSQKELEIVIDEHIDKYFYFIDSKDFFSPEELIEKKKEMISRYGIVGFITDPWFSLNHKGQSKFGNVADYIQDVLNKENYFTEKYNVIEMILHHPPTPDRKTGGDKELSAPSPFQLVGGAMWFNRIKQMICIHRLNRMDNIETLTGFHVQKSKEQKLAGLTTPRNTPVIFNFDRRSNRYLESEDVSNPESRYKVFPFENLFDINEQFNLEF